MDAKEKSKDSEQLQQLLRKADLEGFVDPLRHIGVQRVAHLQDMRPVDFSEVGMSHLEQTRLKRCMKEEKGWKWTKLSEKLVMTPRPQVLRKSSSSATDKASSSEKRSSSGAPSPLSARGRGHDHSALNAIAAWKPQKPSWSIASNCTFRERHRYGAMDRAGSIYEGLHRVAHGDERLVYLLQLEPSRIEGREFRKEIALLHGLDCPNVMKFHGIVFDQPPYLVMDMCHRGTLAEELALRGEAFLLMDLLQLAEQVGTGMKYLESKALVHGELKASSVLMKSAKQCQVANFALAQPMAGFYHGEYDDYANPAASSYKWHAPEVIKSHQYTHEGDVWGYGCLLWEMTSHGESPWAGFNAVQVVAEADFPCRRRLQRPRHCPVDLYALMHKCWSHEPKDRPLFAAIDTLTKQCTPKQLIACETIEHCGERQLPIEAGGLVTVVESDPAKDVWFGQNTNGQYGEFSPSTVTYSDDIVNTQRNSYLAQEAGSNRSSRSSTVGDPNISHPYDVKKLPVEPDVQRLIEELTGVRVSRSESTSSDIVVADRALSSPHRSLTGTASTPTSITSVGGRHRVLTNRQPKPVNGSRSFTPDPAPTSSGVLILQKQTSAHSDLYATRLRVPDSPGSGQHRIATALTRRITDPVMTPTKTAAVSAAAAATAAAQTSVFRFPDVGSSERYTPTSQHEEQPTIVEVYESEEAIYDIPRNRRRSSADYEDVGAPSLSTSMRGDSTLLDSDSGYSPSCVESPLSEAARQKSSHPAFDPPQHQPADRAEIQLSLTSNSSDFLRLPPGGRGNEPHYRSPRITPVAGGKRIQTPSLQGSSPRQSVQSDVHDGGEATEATPVTAATDSCLSATISETNSQRAEEAITPEEAGYRRPSLGKRPPPPVPLRDPGTALSRNILERSGSGNTFAKPSTPSDCGSPVPIIQIHEPSAEAPALKVIRTSSASSTSALSPTAQQPAMERIQRGWQRICKRQKLITSRHNLRASERQYRPAAATAAVMQVPEPLRHAPLSRQKSNPLIALNKVGRNPMCTLGYENAEVSGGSIYRAKSTPNLFEMNLD